MSRKTHMAESAFEKDLEKLEKTVQALEEGGLSLEDALKRFEEGIRLAKRCEKVLSEAEKRIEILTKTANGEVEANSFDEESQEAANGNAPQTAPPPSTPPGTDDCKTGDAEDEATEQEEAEDERGLLF
jgi:exodeoxyribonuclease VII small subunit